jgi:REP element-mobilizing transposase RayT
MPRIARIAPKGLIYHILTRGNNRQDIFKEERDYKKYIEILHFR